MPALVLGTTAAIGARFSASGFWDEVRAFGATVFDFMGATLDAAAQAAGRAGRRATTRARLAWGVPVPDWAPEFEARFGLRVVELYGSTDAGVPIYQPLHEPRVPGSCGRAIDAYEVRIVGDDREPVATARSARSPCARASRALIPDGYYGMPEETAAARRDGWFHTGDLATRDADGNFFFAGRRKEVDPPPRREHLGVRGRGGRPRPSRRARRRRLRRAERAERGGRHGRGRRAPRPRASTRPTLVAHCDGSMARYMVPRYVEVLDALPRTPTEKVEKYRLAERGVTATTWDREAWLK